MISALVLKFKEEAVMLIQTVRVFFLLEVVVFDPHWLYGGFTPFEVGVALVRTVLRHFKPHFFSALN